MEFARFRECLSADYARMREVIDGRDLSARVPSCPDWNAADLVQHTGMVYLHKAVAMQSGLGEGDWPPPGTEDEDPVALFDRAYKELNAEFDAREPGDKTATWYDPDQTVGFWIRRMAQETVIHRVDAELAMNEPIAPIPDDLAVDGIDEILVVFLSYATTKWTQHFEDLKDADGRAVRVAADGASWNARIATDGVHIGKDGDAAATVSGTPADVLLWLWGRKGEDAVQMDGDTGLIKQIRTLIANPALQ
jgi:uncharacterized protein (TIGR03083 family)